MKQLQKPENPKSQIIGGLLCWFNVQKLLKDKSVVGVYWPIQAFFSLWGLWNLYYYPALGQWASFVGGLFLVLGNTAWVVLAAYYSRSAGGKRNDDCEV